MPCLCFAFCENLFYELVLPCFMVSVLRVLGVLGSQDLKQPKNNKKNPSWALAPRARLTEIAGSLSLISADFRLPL